MCDNKIEEKTKDNLQLIINPIIEDLALAQWRFNSEKRLKVVPFQQFQTWYKFQKTFFSLSFNISDVKIKRF